MHFTKAAVAVMAQLIDDLESLPTGEFLVLSKCPNGDIMIQASKKNKGKKSDNPFVDLTATDSNDDNSTGTNKFSDDDDSSTDFDGNANKTNKPSSKNIKKKIHASPNPNLRQSYLSTSDSDDDDFDKVFPTIFTRNSKYVVAKKKANPPKKKTAIENVQVKKESKKSTVQPMRKSARINSCDVAAPLSKEKKGNRNTKKDEQLKENSYPQLDFDSDYSEDNQFSQQFGLYKKLG